MSSWNAASSPDQAASSPAAAGCGLAGCLTGLFAGALIGGLVLLLPAFFLALQAPLSQPDPGSQPDLRLTLQEPYLNRLVRSSAGESARVDLQPENRVETEVDTVVAAPEGDIPVRLITLFALEPLEQTVDLRLIDMQAANVVMTPELRQAFMAILPDLNPYVVRALSDISLILGEPVTITGLETTETTIRLEAAESP